MGFVPHVGHARLRWVDGCTSSRIALSSVIAFPSRPICAPLTTKCSFGANATYSLVHVLDTAAINLEFCQHLQSLLPVESPLVASPGAGGALGL